MKKIVLILCCLLATQLSFSQREASKTLDFENTVDDLLVVPFNGITVISDGAKVYAYDPEQEKIIWEAPNKVQQVWFIKLLGQNVNLGNIRGDEVIALETTRIGIRGDTFDEFLK